MQSKGSMMSGALPKVPLAGRQAKTGMSQTMTAGFGEPSSQIIIRKSTMIRQNKNDINSAYTIEKGVSYQIT